MTHPGKSTDEKRTIVFSYSPGNNIIQYLTDMRGLINRAIINEYSYSWGFKVILNLLFSILTSSESILIASLSALIILNSPLLFFL